MGGARKRFYRIKLGQAVVPPPVIQSLRVTNNIATIVWNSFASVTYRLEYKSNLRETNWNAVLPDITASGPTATATNVIGNASERLYRIMVVPTTAAAHEPPRLTK